MSGLRWSQEKLRAGHWGHLVLGHSGCSHLPLVPLQPCYPQCESQCAWSAPTAWACPRCTMCAAWATAASSCTSLFWVLSKYSAFSAASLWPLARPGVERGWSMCANSCEGWAWAEGWTQTLVPPAPARVPCWHWQRLQSSGPNECAIQLAVCPPEDPTSNELRQTHIPLGFKFPNPASPRCKSGLSSGGDWIPPLQCRLAVSLQTSLLAAALINIVRNVVSISQKHSWWSVCVSFYKKMSSGLSQDEAWVKWTVFPFPRTPVIPKIFLAQPCEQLEWKMI